MATGRIEYHAEYGVKSSRRDRFDGEPSWLETCVREYELGPHGHRHECLVYCKCISCSRLSWLDFPYCKCKLGKLWGRALTLDDGMRRKSMKCRCRPECDSYPSTWTCKCLSLVVDTQEAAASTDADTDADDPFPSPDSPEETSMYTYPEEVIERWSIRIRDNMVRIAAEQWSPTTSTIELICDAAVLASPRVAALEAPAPAGDARRDAQRELEGVPVVSIFSKRPPQSTSDWSPPRKTRASEDSAEQDHE